MKRVRTQPNKRSGEQGSMLVVALVVASVLGVTLGSYMVVVRSQHVSAVRSQAWHKAMSVAEAGAEEALAQLNPGAVAPAVNRSANNWAASGGWYGPVSRTLSGGGTYDVSFSADPAPIIYSTGYVAVPTLSATLTRVLRVATTNAPLFNAAVAVKSGLSMVNYSGKGLFSDSFDSLYGQYPFGLPNKTKSKGDIAVLSGTLNIGTNSIQGDLLLGPAAKQGSPQVLGEVSHDFNVDFPDVVMPSTSWIPASAKQNTNFTYSFYTSGDYSIGATSGSIYVDSGAQVRLKISSASYTASAIRVASAGSHSGKLAIYMTGAAFTLSGTAVVDNGNAANLNYFGLAANNKISIGPNTDFTGTIYAPFADLSINGRFDHYHGSTHMTSPDFIGSFMAKSLAIDGRCIFHFDENLLRSGALVRGYLVSSWREL